MKQLIEILNRTKSLNVFVSLRNEDDEWLIQLSNLYDDSETELYLNLSKIEEWELRMINELLNSKQEKLAKQIRLDERKKLLLQSMSEEDKEALGF